jgi:hypothetical protein
VFVGLGTSAGLGADSVPDFVRATARSRRMTSFVNCCSCQLVANREDIDMTYQFLIEYIESLVKTVVGDWELLFEAFCARECCFGGRLIGGSEEPTSLFELWIVRRVCVDVDLDGLR